MAAALFAARQGAHVVLLERNEKLGKKLYITGKGRCNVTNTAGNLMPFIPRNPRFLYAAFACLDAVGLRQLLLEAGCPTKEERGGRVFPVSEKASDVTRALEKTLRLAGVEIRVNERASSLAPLLEKGPVVLATGGMSYPMTGSTGDGYRLAEAAGHTVLAPRASLVPLETAETWSHQLAGLSLENVRLTATVGKKVLMSELGEMLFTHTGVSGPLILTLSSRIVDADLAKLSVRIDMKPGLTEEKLTLRIQRDLDAAPRKHVASILPGLLPARMGEPVLALAEIPADVPCNQITRQQRARLVETLKAIPLTISGSGSLAEAVITRGGIPVSEVNPATMASKRCPGLYFAGELLDVDAETGGFNLQIAFSTGALAGKSAAEGLLD